ncbi:LysM repeat protein [Cytobacillus purgationiresistens]|uniref:LysM repeat protein n=2 Tax=Cytobacillus purgationiresistens TaxID=863449 RepID=A0ABU0ADW4_9BACI|nr:LysM repeat protein [Cytobacillus purgationiresistens]
METRQRRLKAKRRKIAGLTVVIAVVASFAIGLGGKNIEAAYMVQAEDTLYRIALKHDISVNELKKLNQLKDNHIYAGQILGIPSSELYEKWLKHAAVYTVAPGDTLWSISQRFEIPIEDLKKVNNLVNDFVFINQKLIISDDVSLTKAKIIGAADNFTLEFKADRDFFTLHVPYGAAAQFQNLSGKEFIITHKNGTLLRLN